jgi:hypothetical protein
MSGLFYCAHKALATRKALETFLKLYERDPERSHSTTFIAGETRDFGLGDADRTVAILSACGLVEKVSSGYYRLAPEKARELGYIKSDLTAVALLPHLRSRLSPLATRVA